MKNEFNEIKLDVLPGVDSNDDFGNDSARNIAAYFTRSKPAKGHPSDQATINKKIKALLVDDNYEFFTIVGLTLADHFELDYAPDGFTALQMVKRSRYDIILCDIYMPLVNGLTLFTEFKKKNINTPFLFITGNANEKVINEALQLGAYNLLEKPFGKDDLLAKVQLALELHAREEPTLLADQDKAFIYNTLKTYYYDVEKIMRSIQQINMPVSTIELELDKKMRTGKCLFDDLGSLKHFRAAS